MRVMSGTSARLAGRIVTSCGCAVSSMAVRAYRTFPRFGTSQTSSCHVLLTWHEQGPRPAQSATDAEENEESIMSNWYTVEIEADFRRREWQRAVEADARVAQACPANGRM